jgi:hypothetical protein
MGRKDLKRIGREEKPRKKITFFDQRFCYNFISLLAIMVPEARLEYSSFPYQQTLDTHSLPFDFSPLIVALQKFNKFKFTRFFQSISNKVTSILPDHSP